MCSFRVERLRWQQKKSAASFVTDATSEAHLTDICKQLEEPGRTGAAQYILHALPSLLAYYRRNDQFRTLQRKTPPGDILKGVLSLGLDLNLVDPATGYTPCHSFSCRGRAEDTGILGKCRPNLAATSSSEGFTPEELAKDSHVFCAEFKNVGRKLAEFRTKGFPSIAELAHQEEWWALKSLCRRRVVPPGEVHDKFKGKDAFQWAKHHGQDKMAKELCYFLLDPHGAGDSFLNHVKSAAEADACQPATNSVDRGRGTRGCRGRGRGVRQQSDRCQLHQQLPVDPSVAMMMTQLAMLREEVRKLKEDKEARDRDEREARELREARDREVDARLVKVETAVAEPEGASRKRADSEKPLGDEQEGNQGQHPVSDSFPTFGLQAPYNVTDEKVQSPADEVTQLETERRSSSEEESDSDESSSSSDGEERSVQSPRAASVLADSLSKDDTSSQAGSKEEEKEGHLSEPSPESASETEKSHVNEEVSRSPYDEKRSKDSDVHSSDGSGSSSRSSSSKGGNKSSSSSSSGEDSVRSGGSASAKHQAPRKRRHCSTTSSSTSRSNASSDEECNKQRRRPRKVKKFRKKSKPITKKAKRSSSSSSAESSTDENESGKEKRPATRKPRCRRKTASSSSRSVSSSSEGDGQPPPENRSPMPESKKTKKCSSSSSSSGSASSGSDSQESSRSSSSRSRSYSSGSASEDDGRSSRASTTGVSGSDRSSGESSRSSGSEREGNDDGEDNGGRCEE